MITYKGMATTTERKTAAERRESVLEAALTEFADKGFEGASTDTIARAAGISQPYLFRLFGTKKELFIATETRCFADTYARFEEVSRDLTGQQALEAMGAEYALLVTQDQRRLRGQLQAYAACDDPEICEVVRRGYRRLVELVEGKGVDREAVSAFFARGMLINVVAAMNLLGGEEDWAKRLLWFCWPDD